MYVLVKIKIVGKIVGVNWFFLLWRLGFKFNVFRGSLICGGEGEERIKNKVVAFVHGEWNHFMFTTYDLPRQGSTPLPMVLETYFLQS